jgi:uncharacterized membrane protein
LKGVTVATPDVRKLLVIGFDDPLKANEFMLAVLRLRRNGLVQVHDAVFVQRDAEGRSAVQETQDISTGRGALGGGLWGVLIGTLLGGPVGGLIGGAATAGSGALLAKLIDTGIKDDRIAELRNSVPPGSTALALLVSHLSVADLQRELARFPGAALVESDLPDAAVAAVRNALAEARQPYDLPPAPAAPPAAPPADQPPGAL